MRAAIRLVATLSAFALLTGCSPSQSVAPSSGATSSSINATIPPRVESTASIEPTITMTARVRSGVMYVDGTTNLMDGARLDWQIGSWAGESGDPQAAGRVTVNEGKFAFHAKVASMPGPALYGFAVFGSGAQPQSVRQAYGKYGQNLKGPNVYRQGQYRMIEALVTVNHRK